MRVLGFRSGLKEASDYTVPSAVQQWLPSNVTAFPPRNELLKKLRFENVTF